MDILAFIMNSYFIIVYVYRLIGFRENMAKWESKVSGLDVFSFTKPNIVQGLNMVLNAVNH